MGDIKPDVYELLPALVDLNGNDNYFKTSFLLSNILKSLGGLLIVPSKFILL